MTRSHSALIHNPLCDIDWRGRVRPITAAARLNCVLGACPRFLDCPLVRNYIVTMKTRIIRIGNSQGIRIPKLYLQQTGLDEEVELDVQDKEIVIRSAGHPRQGWAEAFSTMAERGDDQLLDKESNNQSGWDEAEWQW